jgi:CheY-like chemotaxis protein
MLSAAGTGRNGRHEGASESPRPLSRSGRPLEVLIVEDEALTAMDFAHMVEDAGGRAAATASSASEAEALAKAMNPDVVLMDVRLAGTRDGVEAAYSIRTFSQVPIIFVTGNIDRGTTDRIRAFNGSEPVPKPVDQTRLIAAVLNALGRPGPTN